MKIFKIIIILITLLIINSVFSVAEAASIHVVVTGDEFTFTSSPILRDGVVFIPVDEDLAATLASRLGGELAWDPSENKISISKDKHKSYFIINNNIGVILNKPFKLSQVPFMNDGHPYVPLNHLSAAFMSYYNFDASSNTVCLSPKIVNISYLDNSDGGEISIDATGPIKYMSQLLSNPPRIAIDIPNVILAMKEDCNINNKVIKSIKASQFSHNPDLVRVVIELKSPISIRVASRIRLDQVKLKLNYVNDDAAVNDTNTPVTQPPQQQQSSSLTTQQITNVKFEVMNDVRKIFITTTGPVNYEWHRLKSPDNRFYIDFTDAVLVEKKLTISVQDKLLSDIRVGQYQKNPNIVRLVFKLDHAVEMKMSQSDGVANQLKIEIGTNTIDESYMNTVGSGAIGYLNSGKTIVIDPGHGGGDYGAINPQTALAEKDITLDICLRLQDLLLKAGWNAVLTHSTDREVTSSDNSDSEELWARANVANQAKADLFISIHCDASSNSKAQGTTTYYNKDIDKSFALILHRSLISNEGTLNRGVKKANFYVLKHTNMPAVLVESAFISNSEDAQLLADPDVRQKIAEGIYNGVCQYLKNPVTVGEK